MSRKLPSPMDNLEWAEYYFHRITLADNPTPHQSEHLMWWHLLMAAQHGELTAAYSVGEMLL